MKNYTITVNGKVYEVTVEEREPGAVQQKSVQQTEMTKQVVKTKMSDEGAVKVTAPMPGKILSIQTAEGRRVKRGEPLVILEAMKMENEIVAPEDGVVASVHISTGDVVEAGDVLLSLD